MISEKRKETYKMKNCGISRWDDPAEINRKLKYLTSQPIWEVDDDYYDNVVMKYFDEKCKGSREIYEESQKYIPGGVQHNLAFNKPFPMCMAKTDGAYLYDQDGNEYIDFLQAGGPTILGSNYPVVREKVIDLLNTCGHPRHLFFGGYEGAERTVCAFLPDWQEAEDWQGDGESCPVRALRCTWSGGQKLTHRDFLGSILGLGLDREKVGDLLVGDGRCDVLALEEVADFLVFHMEQAGRVKLKCSPLPLDRLEPPAVETRTIRDTVSSLRLDAVAASGFSLSRGKAADLIASGRVQLNHRECVKPDHAVAQGDVLSCRGLGKCVLTEVGGPSKKGRILIVLERYV